MKDYTFEYTRQGFTYLLFALAFAIIVFGIYLFRVLFKDTVSPAIAVIVIIALGVGFFLLNKHKIKRTGTAKLSVGEVTMELNEIISIPFSDLKYYYIYDDKNGIVFTLGFINGKKIKIGANNNFCNDDLIKAFLTDLQIAIESYKAQHNVNIVHLETIFARKQTLYILSILSILVIIGLFSTHMPVMILPFSLSISVAVGWIRYFQQKSRGKSVDF